MLGRDGFKRYMQLIKEAYPSQEDYFKWFKWLFRGGYVHSNILLTGIKIGSKKKKVWAYINNLDVSPAQKDQLSILCTYDSGLKEAPWNTGAKTLPGVSGGTSAKEILGLPMAGQKEPSGTNVLLLP